MLLRRKCGKLRKNSSSNAPSTNQQMALGMAVKSRAIPCEQSSSSTA